MSRYMIVNITWNSKGWEDVSHDKSSFGYVKDHPRIAPGESWNFYLHPNSMNKKGFFQTQYETQPKRYQNGGIIFFFSRNNSQNKNYLVGVYAKAKYIGQTKYGNIYAPADFCLKFYKYIEFNRGRHLPPDRIRIPRVNYTYITEKNAKNILNDALKMNASVTGIEDNSDPKSDFIKLKKITKFYFKDIKIPEFHFQDQISAKFDDFIRKEFPNFLSDDRIKIVKDNAKLKKSYSRHQDLLNRVIDTLREKGWHRCGIPSDADLLASKGQTLIIVEAKSITNINARSQIRNAISQLYQYSYELDKMDQRKQRLVLLLEKCPEQYWFDFCEYCDIELWYKENKVIVATHHKGK